MNNNKKNSLWRGDSLTAALLFVGVICIVLAAGAACVWPGLVAEDTASFEFGAGALITLAGLALAVRK